MTSTPSPGDTDLTGDDVVLLEVSDRIATITLNRPGARNALSSEVLTKMSEAMRKVKEAQKRIAKKCGVDGKSLCTHLFIYIFMLSDRAASR